MKSENPDSRSDDSGGELGPSVASTGPEDRQRLALERDMQSVLRRDLSALEAGLIVADDGADRAVTSGFIDILATDAAGTRVVIDLKAGKADARAIGQTPGHMGDLLADVPQAPVRGFIVARDFDQRARSAARAVPNLALATFSITFHFSRSD